jgi:hypothetical protein
MAGVQWIDDGLKWEEEEGSFGVLGLGRAKMAKPL